MEKPPNTCKKKTYEHSVQYVIVDVCGNCTIDVALKAVLTDKYGINITAPPPPRTQPEDKA